MPVAVEEVSTVVDVPVITILSEAPATVSAKFTCTVAPTLRTMVWLVAFPKPIAVAETT